MVAYYTIIEDDCEAGEGVEDVGTVCVFSCHHVHVATSVTDFPLRAHR